MSKNGRAETQPSNKKQMVFTTIAAIVMAYLVFIFIISRLFEKLFKLMILLSTLAFAAAIIYLSSKGG